jgi:DNA-damage-inducible protein D
MEILGYDSWAAFRQVINKAIATCTTIGADIVSNFAQARAEVAGELVEDFKLSKLACYLVAMQGDPRKPQVALAQAYFATLAVAFQKCIRGAEDVERVEIRQRVSDHERQLQGTVSAHGVENYAFFQDAGYRGLYNMSLRDLRNYKGDPTGGKRTLLDFMGKREPAANPFRLTETKARIKAQDVRVVS